MKRKNNTSFIELSKFKFYLLFQTIFIGLVFCYQLCWYFGKTTKAACYVYGRLDRLEESGTLYYRYIVDGKTYEDYTTRNGTPIAQDSIEIKYLRFWPSVSRINSFEGNWLGFIIAYAIYFAITSIIFLIPNDTMPRNSYIYFTKKKPWVNMIIK